MMPRINDDRADRLAAEIFDNLAMPLLVDPGEIGRPKGNAGVDGCAGKIGRGLSESRFLKRARGK